MNQATMNFAAETGSALATVALGGRVGIRVLWQIGSGDGARRMSVNVRIDDRRAGVSAMMIGGSEPRTFDAPASIAVDREHGLVHVDAPGVLSLTFAPANDGHEARLLYARTPLLMTMGVAGGQSEAPRLEWSRVLSDDER